MIQEIDDLIQYKSLLVELNKYGNVKAYNNKIICYLDENNFQIKDTNKIRFDIPEELDKYRNLLETYNIKIEFLFWLKDLSNKEIAIYGKRENSEVVFDRTILPSYIAINGGSVKFKNCLSKYSVTRLYFDDIISDLTIDDCHNKFALFSMIKDNLLFGKLELIDTNIVSTKINMIYLHELIMENSTITGNNLKIHTSINKIDELSKINNLNTIKENKKLVKKK